MTTVICYMGGTAGDLITALIDPQDAELDKNVISHVPARSALKKPHTFASDSQKIQYLDSVNYASVPSHDFEFHCQYQHDIILVIVETMEAALWAANRFSALHRARVWKEMTLHCGADTTASYAQALLDFSNVNRKRVTRTVCLESVLNGSLINCLQELVPIKNLDASQRLYQQWLAAQK